MPTIQQAHDILSAFGWGMECTWQVLQAGLRGSWLGISMQTWAESSDANYAFPESPTECLTQDIWLKEKTGKQCVVPWTRKSWLPYFGVHPVPQQTRFSDTTQ